MVLINFNLNDNALLTNSKEKNACYL
jgi:hypothetical protein